MKLLSIILLLFLSFSQLLAQVNIKTGDTLTIIKSNKYYSCEINYINFYNNGKNIKMLNDSINGYTSYLKNALENDLDDDIKSEMDSGFIAGKYILIVNTKYNILQNGTISIFFEIYYYTLGAHGNVFYKSLHYSTTNNEFIQLPEIANINGQDDLDDFNILLLKYFDNKDSCFSSKPKIETENYNMFYVDDKNLTIVFPAYELGSYACGAAFIKIPLYELKK